MQCKGFSICPYYAIRVYILPVSPAKWSRRKDALRHAGTLQRRVHPGYLRPRHHVHAEAGGERGGEFPLRYSPALTAPGSRMGHGLGQTDTAKLNHPEKYRKQKQNHGNSMNFCGFGVSGQNRFFAFKNAKRELFVLHPIFVHDFSSLTYFRVG